MSRSLALIALLCAACTRSSWGCKRSANDADCAGHGTCDFSDSSNPKCQCDPSGIWGDTYCDTANQANIWPQIGAIQGGTDVAIVLYDLDITPYLNNPSELKVVLWQGFGVFRFEIVCNAYGIKTPWEQPDPGAPLGWASTVSSFVRNYGEGYHIYDDNQTQLGLQNNSFSNRASAIEFRTEAAPNDGYRAFTYNVSIRVGGNTEYHLNATQYNFTFHTGVASITSVTPTVIGYAAGTQVTIQGTGFHEQGTAYTDQTWLKDTTVRLKVGPSELPRVPMWPADMHLYVPFTISSDRTTIVLTLPAFPINTVNTTALVQVSRNRQEFFDAPAYIRFNNVPKFTSVDPFLTDLSHLTRFTPIPFQGGTAIEIEGANFVNTSLIAAKLMVSLKGPRLSASTVVGLGPATFISDQLLKLMTPPLDLHEYDFPEQMCQTRASHECLCQAWHIKEPTWNLYGNRCCLQPFEHPDKAPWCYCERNPEALDGVKVRQPVSQLCDPMFEATPIIGLKFLVALNSTLGDYKELPVPMAVFKPPKGLSFSPSHVPFHETTRIEISGGPFLHVNLLMARVVVNSTQSVPGSSTPIPVNITFVNPRLVYFDTPIWPISNTSVDARIELTQNGQYWHDMGYYTYITPTFSKILPSDVDANGEEQVAIVGQSFMNTSKAAIRLRTKRGLLTELARLKKSYAAVLESIDSARGMEASLRERANVADTTDATELRRMELEAHETPDWFADHRRRPEAEFLNVTAASLAENIKEVERCLAAEHTYVVPLEFVSSTQMVFDVPALCMPKLCVGPIGELLVELDVTSNTSHGVRGYQMDILHLFAFNRSCTPTENPGTIELDRSFVPTKGGFAAVGTFEGTLTTGPRGESLDHTQVCKYVVKGQETLRYNNKGVLDTDPHAQVPSSLFTQETALEPKEFDTSTKYDVVHCYKVPRKPLVSAGKRDGYLMKFNSSNQMIWSVRMGGSLDDEMASLASDWVGNIYVAGHFPGSNFSLNSKVLKQMVDAESTNMLYDANLTQKSSAVRKLFVAKYDQTGGLKFAVEIGACIEANRDVCRIHSIDTDKVGNIYVSGVFYGIMTFGSMCASSHCETYVQSEMGEKTRNHVVWSDPKCNATSSMFVSCKRIPVVKMRGMKQCHEAYSGQGKSCDEDIFVAMFDPTGQLMWAKSVNTQNTWVKHTNAVDIISKVVDSWSNRAYWAYFNLLTLRQGTRFPYASNTAAQNDPVNQGFTHL